MSLTNSNIISKIEIVAGQPVITLKRDVSVNYIINDGEAVSQLHPLFGLNTIKIVGDEEEVFTYTNFFEGVDNLNKKGYISLTRRTSDIVSVPAPADNSETGGGDGETGENGGETSENGGETGENGGGETGPQLECLTYETVVKVISSNVGNVYTFNDSDSYDSDKQYG